MTSLLHSLTLFSASASGALLSAIWEGAVLAVCVVLCLRLLPRLGAAVRSFIWLNVFVLLLLLHFVPALESRASGLAATHLSTVHATIHLDLRWSLAIAAVWVGLSLWRAWQLINGAIHLHRLAQRATPVSVDPELRDLLSVAPGGRHAELCASDEVARPSVLGFFHPRVLVPPALIRSLSAVELQQVVLHEMEHLRRADDWTNLLQKIGLVLFPLNPVLLWVERRLCAERELACDDRVVRSSAGRKSYALCLTHLAEYSIMRRSFSLVLGAWERRPELVRRVHRILSQPVRSMGRTPAILAAGGLLGGALGCALVLARSPQFVSFTPAATPAQLAQSLPPLNPQELANALGGTPRLMKAELSRPSVQDNPGRSSSFAEPATLHTAVSRRRKCRRPAPSRLAGLHPLPLPVPDQIQRMPVVLTEFRVYEAPPRVVLAVSPDHRLVQGIVRPAIFAVATPNGWLIIQI